MIIKIDHNTNNVSFLRTYHSIHSYTLNIRHRDLFKIFGGCRQAYGAHNVAFEAAMVQALSSYMERGFHFTFTLGLCRYVAGDCGYILTFNHRLEEFYINILRV